MIIQAIEEKVEKLLSESNAYSIPVKPELCAIALNIKINPVELEDNISGFLAISNGVATLGYNNAHSVNRQRFTIAHELGHFILHALDSPLFIDRQYNRDDKSSTGEIAKEREANNFAAALLMPRKHVKEYIENTKNKEKSASQLIREMAKKFEVSEQALGIRISQLGYWDYDTAY